MASETPPLALNAARMQSDIKQLCDVAERCERKAKQPVRLRAQQRVERLDAQHTLCRQLDEDGHKCPQTIDRVPD